MEEEALWTARDWSDVERTWDELARRHWKALWAEDQPSIEHKEAARTALWRFFNTVEDELTHHRLEIEELRREVALLRERPIMYLEDDR